MTPIARQIKELHDKSLSDLRQLWKEYFQTEPPPYRRAFVIQALAYRIQELTFGGLSSKTKNRLDDLLDNARKSKSRRRTAPTKLPIAGTRLIREWKGNRYEVIILTDGFEYAGRKWNSLTAIARDITGTHWNGPVFFGLRQKAKSSTTETAA